MVLFRFEHSTRAYWADMGLYAAAVLGLTLFLAAGAPAVESVALAIVGLCAWTALEYALHRFVLHGLEPFSRWHAQHHQRPAALICTPTALSATLVVTMVFVPALLLGNVARACALTLGLLGGYLAYAITHHATHHWRAGSAWLQRRKRWHALHHRAGGGGGHYGVTTVFWDRVLGTAGAAGPARGTGP